jgi:hypothetical protein
VEHGGRKHQKIGRNIRCFGMRKMTKDEAAAEWQAARGGRRIAAGSIVTPNGLLSRSRCVG